MNPSTKQADSQTQRTHLWLPVELGIGQKRDGLGVWG